MSINAMSARDREIFDMLHELAGDSRIVEQALRETGAASRTPPTLTQVIDRILALKQATP